VQVCHARISTPSAQLGLPELQLGIIPGLGGTQRLPRLVGLQKALEMMLTSKAIKGREAHEVGLVDAVTSANELVNTACSWALEIVENKKPWFKSLYRTDRLPDLVEVKDVLKFARVQTKKKAPNVQHPIVCIDVIEEGIVCGPRVGLMKEALSAKMVEQSQTSKSLRHFFFAQRATSKIPNITNIGLTPRKIKKAAIVGGGLMGSGIATVLILNNFKVILKEINEQFLSAGINRVRGNLQSFVRKGQLTKEDCERKFSLLSGVLDYEQFRDADLVVEAVIEDILLKQKIFSDLEKYCHHNCIFATNTSTIDLNLIGQKTGSQDRIVGAHFFSPAHVMPLLEIVRTHQTSLQAIVDLLDMAKKIHKTPIVAGNCTGFAVNRMFFPYGQAASFLVDYGLDVYHIDNVITQFGMPMGPFRLADLVGFGVATATRKQYFQSYPERCYKSMLLLQILLEDNRTGESSRKGFYVYDDKRKASQDPDLRKYIEKSRNMGGVTQDPKVLCYILLCF
jgi:enoyl-CoA hydratase/3-hydroxyacyl-CoA dehydrogenase